MKEIDSLSLSTDQHTGAKMVRKSLEGPLRQIAQNAGKDAAEVLATLKAKPAGTGYNANTDVYEDLFRAGVIDPTKVVRNAVQTASSIAAMVITTEALVADFDDEKDTKTGTIII